MKFLITDSRVNGRAVDLRIENERIVEIGPSLERSGSDDVIPVHGGVVVRGLHDHHLHLRALAASMQSVFVGPPEVIDRDNFTRVLRNATRFGRSAWIRAVGYHDSVAGSLDHYVLDQVVADRPLRG